MQLMTWNLARLGSRFGLMFEPHRRQVWHSALGRFLDRPMDLMVGFVEPDGMDRVLPFSNRGKLLHNPEQFERINSVTFRGFSERYRLRFEFNVHSVFYPQNERLCLMPAFYLEMRISPSSQVRRIEPVGPVPQVVKMFIRLDRPGTKIEASVPVASADGVCDWDALAHGARIDLAYANTLTPRRTDYVDEPLADVEGAVEVHERIVSLNPGVEPDADGRGLTLELPVTESGSGVKWRLVWGAFCGQPVLHFRDGDHRGSMGRLRYTEFWSDLDQVMHGAVRNRDDWLAHSRRFEKVVEQAPLRMAQRHLVNQSFQTYLSNTFWCVMGPESAGPEAGADGEASRGAAEPRGATGAAGQPRSRRQWFGVWEGSRFQHSTVNAEYCASLLHLSIWPGLLAMQLEQWASYERMHGPSRGSYLSHHVEAGVQVRGQPRPVEMPVEDASGYLLLLQAYCHWTGDVSLLDLHGKLVERLAKYLIWSDTERCGFPAHGTENPFDDAGPVFQLASMQTYLAVKRLAGLQAAGDLLRRVGLGKEAAACDEVVERDAPKIESQAWLGDHYAVCVDPNVAGDIGLGLSISGWDAYSIHTGNGLLLPSMIGQGVILSPEQLRMDLANAFREAMGPYGCGHSSEEIESVWVSENLWRDHLVRYLGGSGRSGAERYWDLQVMSNTYQQSLGFCDTYINNDRSFSPRGVVSFGYFLALPRVVIDRLAPGGARISVEPDRHISQRWPLLPLADWKAGKIPICVVDAAGNVTIEGKSDPVIIHGQKPENLSVIG